MTKKNWTLVTGAALGLGKAIALHLARLKHQVVIHYNTHQKEAEETVEACRKFGVKAEIIQGDFSTYELREEFLNRYRERFSSTEFLVNNIGFYLKKPLSETSEMEWEEIFALNVSTPFHLIKGLLPQLKAAKGKVVNIGIAGLEGARGYDKSGAYMAAKLALLGMSRSFAKELAPFGITVNMVSPGYLENTVDMPAHIDRLPMKRLARLDEAAALTARFFDKESDYITGQNIEIAGGVRL